VINELKEGPTYYVRAYATNSVGTAYSPTVTSFKICNPFSVIHRMGFKGAPEDTTIIYHTITTSISGDPRCWITQNLGAEREATSVTDADQSAAGWYWQFNRLKAYKPAGASYSPYYAWISWLSGSSNESSNWSANADPCQQMLGSGWRMPTSSEWTKVDAAPQYWSDYTDAFASELKLHAAGYMYSGALASRGGLGRYWSSTQSSYYGYYSGSYATYYTGIFFATSSTGSATSSVEKLGGYAFNVRCLRDTIVLEAPSVTNASFPTSEMTTSTAIGHATVTLDGQSSVTERGFCWSATSSSPTTSDNYMVIGQGVGDFETVLTGLIEGPTYYVRAYAKNSVGISYSPTVTSFKICNPFTVTHQSGINGAAENKTITYNTISSSVSGAPRCWITQNLGADVEAASVTDATDAAAGWYWQFNRIQGYKAVGTTYTPTRSPWLAVGNESSNWTSTNDPCQSLGSGWRMPTSSEWTIVDDDPQYWQTATQAFNSVLKLHESGYLLGGTIKNRGIQGTFWSNTQSSYYGYYSGSYATYYTGIFMSITSTTSATSAVEKLGGYAFSVRCLRDNIP